MQNPENITYIKYLLGIVAFLVSSNIVVVVFIAKKYIKRADCDHDRLNKIITEQEIYHKNDIVNA